MGTLQSSTHPYEPSRRAFLRQALLGGAALCAGQAGAAQEPPRPNILFLISDDQSYETLLAQGADPVATPHLERLLREGTHFTQAYNMGGWSGAICVASRTMLMTGATLWQARALESQLTERCTEGALWPLAMRDAGYDTYFSGKWHVGLPAECCFEHTGTVRPGMPPDTPESYGRPVAGAPDPWSPYDPAHRGFWSGGQHWSEQLADEGISFINAAARRPNPFFMYLAFNAPHDPRQSPKEYVAQYPASAIEIPRNFLAEYPYAEAMGAPADSLRDERLAPHPRTEDAVRVHRSEYFAIISHMDAQIGRILRALEASGKASNTIIVFTSDHGLSAGRHGLMGKQNMYEHSMRVPLILHGPGIARGAAIETPVYFQDVAPTCIEWAGATAPEWMEFKSLRPLLQEPSGQHYPYIYGAYTDRQRMLMHQDLKLIWYARAGVFRLFDLAADPLEINDMAGRVEAGAKLNELQALLLEAMHAYGDPMREALRHAVQPS